MEFSFQIIYTLIVVFLLSLFLLKEWLEPEVAFFAALMLLVVAKIIPIKTAFAGFSNEGMLTIGLLFIVSGALYKSGAQKYLALLFFGKSFSSRTRKLLRSVFPIAAMSAFMNNTPVVAMIIPAVNRWTEKHNRAPSKFFIPISYAAILGGMCTLIGSSTNLIIHGLMLEQGLEGLSFFEISKVGVPVAIIGLLFVAFIGHRLLPERKAPIVKLGEQTREFVIELKVTEDYKFIGSSIEEAGLRHLTGLFLFQIDRGGKIIAPARPRQRILLDDRLFFTGLPKTILELQKTPGLQLVKDSSFDLKNYDSDKIKTFEAVVSRSSPLVGQSVRASNFRHHYGAVIIAIHRNGRRIKKKIGDIVLRAGDTLLLLAEETFLQRWYHSKDFYLTSSAESIPSKPRWQNTFAMAIFALMIILAATGVLPLVLAAGLAALAMVLGRVIPTTDAKEMIEWRVLIIIASALGIAAAVRDSGLAMMGARYLVDLSQTSGVLVGLAAAYVITSIYTTIITNNAAAALIFPLSISMAQAMNADIRPFAIAVAIGAAASFATPISYQTNLMVYGPGGYTFRDFLRIGVPLQLLTGIAAISFIYTIYF